MEKVDVRCELSDPRAERPPAECPARPHEHVESITPRLRSFSIDKLDVQAGRRHAVDRRGAECSYRAIVDALRPESLKQADCASAGRAAFECWHVRQDGEQFQVRVFPRLGRTRFLP
jgi:hypothetical protein